jgi:hypothetical protein
VTAFSRVFAWHLGALGDVILTTPALHLLHRVMRARGGGRLELLAVPARGDLLRRGAACHAAHDGTRADLAPLFEEGGRPPRWLAERLSADSLVVLFFGEAGALARNLAPHVGRVVAVPPRPPAGARAHCADFLRERLAAELGLSARGRARPRIRVDAAARAEVAHARPTLALHPGSGGAAKRLPASVFLEVARRAPASLGLAPLLILGPVERERDPGLAEDARRAGIPVVEEPPLPRLAALLAGARAYLGNDAGPTHLAAAVGTPVLAAFGPSDPAVFAPRGRSRRAPVRVLHAPLVSLSPDLLLAQLEGLAVTGR